MSHLVPSALYQGDVKNRSHRTEQLILLTYLGIASTMAISCADEATSETESPLLGCPKFGSTTFPAALVDGTTTAVGTIPGTFHVGRSGDASYEMQLEVPPGPSGMTPSLSLRYDQGAPEDYVGTGFSFDGFSSIARCPRNLARDNIVDPIHYNMTDRLCLDGQRLAVGLPLSPTQDEFRTIPDTFVKVVGDRSSDGTDYVAFHVYHKDGTRVDYGETSASRVLSNRVLVNGSHVAARWLISSKHRLASTAVVTYAWSNILDASGTTTEYVPASIAYAGRSITFNYLTRQDANRRTRYVDGTVRTMSRLLRSIHVATGSTTVYDYNFAYGAGGTSGRSVLKQVKQCVGATCKPATTFDWYSGNVTDASAWTNVVTSVAASPFPKIATLMTMDVTGDGLDDVITTDVVQTSGRPPTISPITRWRVAANSGHGNYFPASTVGYDEPIAATPDPLNPQQTKLDRGFAMDYDQDGLQDILLYDVEEVGSTWRLLHAMRSPTNIVTFEEIDTHVPRPGSFTHQQFGELLGPDASARIGDVNGDGVADLVQCRRVAAAKYEWAVRYWSPAGFSMAPEVIAPPVTSPEHPLEDFSCDSEVVVTDIDADGRDDIVISNASIVAPITSLYRAVMPSVAGWHMFTLGVPSGTVNGRHSIFVDLNGDGLRDVVQEAPSGTNLSVYFNMGSPTQGGPGYSAQPSFLPAVDGLATQQGASFKPLLALASILDVNADGRRDLLVPLAPPGSAASWVVFRSTGGIGGSTPAPFEMLATPFPADQTLVADQSSKLSYPLAPRITDVNGDGASDVLLFVNGTLNVYLSKLVEEDALKSVTDGMNARTPSDPLFVPNVGVTYSHLIDRSITDGASVPIPLAARMYLVHDASDNTCVYPRSCVTGSQRVVSTYSTNNGADSAHLYEMMYRDARVDRRGHGWLGFGKVITLDDSVQAGTVETFDNVHADSAFGEYANTAPSATRRWTLDQNGLSPARIDVSITSATPMVYYPSPIPGSTCFILPPTIQRTAIQGTFQPQGTLAPLEWALAAEANGTTLSSSTETFDYDEYGNVLHSTSSTQGVGPTIELKRTLEYGIGGSYVDRATSERVCSSVDNTTQCMQTDRVFDSTNAALLSETVSGGDIVTRNVSFTYDSFGNVATMTAKDDLGNTRSECVGYEPSGVYPYSWINGVGHVSFALFDPRYGVPMAVKDPNGLVTQWAADGFGRSTKELRPDGNTTVTTYAAIQDPVHGRVVQAKGSVLGGPELTLQYDELSRETARWTPGVAPYCPSSPCLLEPRVVQYTEYDAFLPRIARFSHPASEFAAPSSLAWNVLVHDAAGRVVRQTSPWGAVTNITYTGNSVRIDEPKGVSKVVDFDARGRRVNVIEPAGTNHVTHFDYGNFDALIKVTAPDGLVTSYAADVNGNRMTESTPDRGTTTTSHDGFGMPITMLDAAGRATSYTFDAIGRMAQRSDIDGVATFTWDAAANGIGRLKTVGMAPTANDPPSRLRTFTYDVLGRIQSDTLAMNAGTFQVMYGYDNFGRIASVTYPQTAGFSTPFGVRDYYDSAGHLNRVTDAANAAIWTLSGVDSIGRTRSETFGNGVVVDRTYDNPKDLVAGITSTKGSVVLQSLRYAWDERRNLTQRADALQGKTEYFTLDGFDRVTCAGFTPTTCATSVAYDDGGSILFKSDVGSYTYDPLHPHAVHTAGMSSFTYDAVGNQITRPEGTISYNASNLPRQVVAYSPASSFTYYYDGFGRKVARVSASEETAFVNGLYERFKPTGGTMHAYHSVYANGRVVAVFDRSGTVQTGRYIQSEHLGSPDVITSDAGTLLERRSYDLFGARRSPNWGTAFAPTISAQPLAYTQQHEDLLGLIDMKGRTYDPVRARFLQSDPVVPAPHRGQSWNSYSYVRNNPLAFLDPSGFDEQDTNGSIPGTSDPFTEGDSGDYDGFTYSDSTLADYPIPTPGNVSTQSVGTTQPSATVDTGTSNAHGERGYAAPPSRAEQLKGLPDCYSRMWARPGDRPLAITGVYAFGGFEGSFPLPHPWKTEVLGITGKHWTAGHPETSESYRGVIVAEAGEFGKEGVGGVSVAHGVEVTKSSSGEWSTEPITTVDLIGGPFSFGQYWSNGETGSYISHTEGPLVLGAGVTWGEGEPMIPERLIVQPMVPFPANVGEQFLESVDQARMQQEARDFLSWP